MHKFYTLIRWGFIKLGYEQMMHVEDIARHVGYSEATVLRLASKLRIKRPGGKRVRQRVRTYVHRRGPRQKVPNTSYKPALEPRPITLAGPEWSRPNRSQA